MPAVQPSVHDVNLNGTRTGATWSACSAAVTGASGVPTTGSHAKDMPQINVRSTIIKRAAEVGSTGRGRNRGMDGLGAGHGPRAEEREEEEEGRRSDVEDQSGFKDF